MKTDITVVLDRSGSMTTIARDVISGLNEFVRKQQDVEGEAWFTVDGSLEQVTTRYYEREALRGGNRLVGPAIVNQYDSTTVIPPGVDAHVDRFGNIMIQVGA